MTTIAKHMLEVAQAQTTSELLHVKAWEKRRPWSRTDSSRFLNDRSETLLALLRRRSGDWPKHSRQFGEWLRRFQPQLFDKAHLILSSAGSDEQRERIIPGDLV